MDLEKILKENSRVLFDVWAPWCGPCKVTTPIIEELEKRTKNVKIVKVNADEERKIIQDLGVISVPTFLYYKDGNLVNQITGVVDKRTLKKLIEEI